MSELVERCEALERALADMTERCRTAEHRVRESCAARIAALEAQLAGEREACALVADKVAADLSWHSSRAQERGDDQTMYRANTAWHRVTEVAELIRTRTAAGGG